MSATAMAAAFRKAGFNPDSAELLCALAKFRNHGNSREQAEELVDYAYMNAGKGQASHAEQGQSNTALSRQPNGNDAGHPTGADKAGTVLPASGAGAGHRTPADKAGSKVPAPRPMSESRREAMMNVGQQRVRTFWDTEIGGVKRRLGSLTRFDIRQVVRRGMIDVHIGNRLLAELKWPDEDTTPLEKIADVDQVKEIVESASSVVERRRA